MVHGVNPVIELLRSTQPVTRVYLGAGPRREELAEAAAGRHQAVESADRTALDRLARSQYHQGAVAVCPPYAFAALEQLLAPACPSVVVLDGVQDPRNLGAILRTARAAGVGGILLPQDRSVGVTPVVVLASAGLLFSLSIARVPNLVRALGALKEAGFWLVGLAADAAQSVFELRPPGRLALVVGGEGEGLRTLVRRTCDFEVGIPMAPGVESLNVAVAAGVALYALRSPLKQAVS